MGYFLNLMSYKEEGNDGNDVYGVVGVEIFILIMNNVCFWNVRGFNRLRKKKEVLRIL